MRSPLLVAALATVASLSLARPSSHVVHERRAGSPRWQKRDRVERHAILPVRIGLTQTNLDKGHDYLMDVSDPASPNYSKHWTPEEVVAAFSPTAETVASVRDWIVANGIGADRIAHSDNRGWLAFDATTDEIERLLHTELHKYEYADGAHTSIACESYHIPAAIQSHIDYITPGVKLSAPLKKREILRRRSGRGDPIEAPASLPDGTKVNPNDLSTCDKYITPACIRALYEVPMPEYTNIVASNTMGVYETGEYYSQKDLDLFFRNFTPYIPKGTHPILDSVDGGEAPVSAKKAGGEPDLDLELMYSLIYPQTITLYQVDDAYYASLNSGDSHSGQFNTWLDSMDGSYCNYSAYGETGNAPIDPVYPDPRPGGYKGKLQCGLYRPTNVISVSYGVQEDDLPEYYQKRQCNEFMKLGLQGTSIVVASGDTGVAGIRRDDGFKNGCLGKHGGVFSPTNPNSCPYVTNVGATELFAGQSINDPESAAYNTPYNYSSSGGFSNIFPIPGYQKSAIDTYFSDHPPPYKSYAHFGLKAIGDYPGRFNRLGRGIPDVAANGQNIATYCKGQFHLTGGTSASAPIFASIINRINELRLRNGKKTLGFLNPALYGNPSMLNDITNGTNPGCHTNGFSAVEGWDPVTGLGTPNYPKMRDYFLSLP